MPNVRQETGRGFAANGINVASMTNTAAEQILFTQVIPAGGMGIAKRLDFYLNALLTTAAITPNITVKIKFGGQEIAALSGIALLALQTNAPFLIEGRIKNTSAQTQESWVKITSGVTSLLGSIPLKAGSWNVDTTVDQTFQITAQFGSALTATTLTVKDADMECS